MFLDYAIRSTLLLAATGAAVLALRGRSSAWRHLVWLAGLLALLALPAVKVLAPQWNAPVVAQRLFAAVPVRTVINVTASASRGESIDWLLIVWLSGAAFLLLRTGRAQVLAARLAHRAVAGPDGVAGQ